MAPIERRAKRLLAWWGIARSADQDGQRIIQAPDYLLGVRRVACAAASSMARASRRHARRYPQRKRRWLRRARSRDRAPGSAPRRAGLPATAECSRHRAAALTSAARAGRQRKPVLESGGSRPRDQDPQPFTRFHQGADDIGRGQDMLEGVWTRSMCVVDEPQTVERARPRGGPAPIAAATVAATTSDASVVASETKPTPSG